MLVHVVAMCMQVVMKIERMSFLSARMGAGRADRASDPGQGENAEQDQHDADRKFHRQTESWWDDDPEQDDRRTDPHHRDGMSHAPGSADQCRARQATLAADDRRNSDHVVGVGRMSHPEEEAEKQEGRDVQGSSRHAHMLTWLPSAMTSNVSTRHQFEFTLARPLRGFSLGHAGRPRVLLEQYCQGHFCS
jgi:hypothetical protein